MDGPLLLVLFILQKITQSVGSLHFANFFPSYQPFLLMFHRSSKRLCTVFMVDTRYLRDNTFPILAYWWEGVGAEFFALTLLYSTNGLGRGAVPWFLTYVRACITTTAIVITIIIQKFIAGRYTPVQPLHNQMLPLPNTSITTALPFQECQTHKIIEYTTFGLLSLSIWLWDSPKLLYM